MYIARRFYQIIAPLLFALLVGFSMAANADTAPDASKDVQEANKLFKQKQYDQALAKINGVLATKPKDAQARFLKGLILMEQGKSEDAITIFSAMTDDYPDAPEPYNNLAVLYAGQGKYEKALSVLQLAIRNHPAYPTAYENMGDIYAKMASKAYERAQQLDPTNPGLQTKVTTIKRLFPKNSVRKPEAPPQQSAPASAPAAAPAAKP